MITEQITNDVFFRNKIANFSEKIKKLIPILYLITH